MGSMFQWRSWPPKGPRRDHGQFTISKRQEGRGDKSSRIDGGEHVEGTPLMVSIFSATLELRPRTEREEGEEVFVVQSETRKINF